MHPRGRVTFAGLSDILTPDDHTVILVLSKPGAIPPHRARGLGDADRRQAPSMTAASPIPTPVNNAPIGTGPFIFKEWVRGSHIIYERNPDYWDQPRPYVDRLVVSIVADEAARSIALETGEAHLGQQTPIPLSDLAHFQTLPNVGIEQRGYSYSNNITRIEFNLQRPQFSDVRVRQAFAHLIDRNVISNTVLYGYAKPIPGPISPTLTKFYDADLPTYDIDLAKAEALLDAAGYHRGGDGIRFRLTHDPHPSAEFYKRGGQYIRQVLAKPASM